MLVRTYFEDNNASTILGEALKVLLSTSDKVLVVCIGTDRVICDCLGPLVATLLTDADTPVQVFGTLDNPIHSENIEVKIKEIREEFPEYKIIAIDGCLGDKEDVGIIKLKEGSISPGAGIGKKLQSVGHYAIEVIIEKKEASQYLFELPIRLRYIFKMAVVIREAFKYAYSYKEKNKLFNNHSL